MSGWQPIDSALPWVAYLVQHEDDLFPVTAYRMDIGQWFYEQDGPEDVIEDGDHRHMPLKRAPTHYRLLPPSPKDQASDDPRPEQALSP